MKTHKLQVQMKQQTTFYVGKDLYATCGRFIQNKGYHKIALIADENVSILHTDKLQKALPKSAKVFRFTVPKGEDAKTLSVVKTGYQVLNDKQFSRDSLIIAIGGGATSDTAGYIASTYLRGINWIIYPTTLLSQVDAAIGGKTGVNFDKTKNRIGAFHNPIAVFADSETLETLPKRQIASGFAEIIKYSVTLNKDLIDILFNLPNKPKPSELLGIIHRCIKLKVRIVEKDPYETKGLRHILNYGHTLGHAIEVTTESSKNYTHGEAISLGMVFATRLSEVTDLCTNEDVRIVYRLLQKFDLPTQLNMKREPLLEKIKSDKKLHEKRIRWVLLHGIGKAITNQIVDEAIVEDVLKRM